MTPPTARDAAIEALARRIYNIWRPLGTDPIADASWFYMIDCYRHTPNHVPNICSSFLCATIAHEAAEKAAAEMQRQCAQAAFDAQSDDPQPGDWNDACLRIKGEIEMLPLTPPEQG